MQVHSVIAMKHSTPRGISIVEVIVCLVLVTVVFVLVAPAMQEARESARRSDCKNKLKRLAMALHNYEETHYVFPAGTDFSATKTSKLQLWSWQFKLLPYIDQAPLFRSFDLAKGISDPTNLQKVGTSLLALHCPSDELVKQPFVAIDELFAGSWALTSYLGMSGADGLLAVGNSSMARPIECQELDDLAKARTRSGVFFGDSAVRARDIRDGTTNTILIGERGVPANRERGWWTGPGLASACPSGWTDVVLPARDNLGLGGIGDSEQGQSNPFRWWSYHPGGTSFVLGDASVRFMPTSTDPKVFQGLSTRSGGESVLE